MLAGRAGVEYVSRFGVVLRWIEIYCCSNREVLLSVPSLSFQDTVGQLTCRVSHHLFYVEEIVRRRGVSKDRETVGDESLS